MPPTGLNSVKKRRSYRRRVTAARHCRHTGPSHGSHATRAQCGVKAIMIAPDWRHAFTRIQIEYIEMPDLKLTLAQIRRLCDLPQDLCERAVAALLQVGFLWRAPDGRFVRRALGRAGREISDRDVDQRSSTRLPDRRLESNTEFTWL